MINKLVAYSFLNSFFHLFLFKNQLLKNLGLKVDIIASVDNNELFEKSSWPLYLSKHTLTIMCQIYALRIKYSNNSNRDTQNEITQIWLLFLNSINKTILKREQNFEFMNNGK